MKEIAAGLALMILAVSPALAQEQGMQNAPMAREAAKMVDAYIISNLQESLELSDEQFARMIPLVKKMQQQRRGLAQRRAIALRELRRRLGSGHATEAEVQDLVVRLDGLIGERTESAMRGYAAIDAELDPIQRGKYRVMEAEVERRIQELMRRAFGRQQDRGQPDRSRR